MPKVYGVKNSASEWMNLIEILGCCEESLVWGRAQNVTTVGELMKRISQAEEFDWRWSAWFLTNDKFQETLDDQCLSVFIKQLLRNCPSEKMEMIKRIYKDHLSDRPIKAVEREYNQTEILSRNRINNG